MTFSNRERVCQVDTVVHTEPRGEDDVDAGDDVNGDVPEVEGPHHVHQGEHDAGHDHHTEVEVAEHEERHEANYQQGQAKVPPQLQRYDGVSLPGLIDLATSNNQHFLKYK